VTPANILVSQEIPLTGVLPAPVVLVEGIEDLQVEYAVDANNNGSLDAGEFEANPADWRQVIGVRVGVLSISPEAGRSPVGARTFGLPGKSIVKADDRIKRRGYSTTIMFESPTARRQS
jgi:type IV pilus assembly protein PilW